MALSIELPESLMGRHALPPARGRGAVRDGGLAGGRSGPPAFSKGHAGTPVEVLVQRALASDPAERLGSRAEAEWADDKDALQLAIEEGRVVRTGPLLQGLGFLEACDVFLDEGGPDTIYEVRRFFEALLPQRWDLDVSDPPGRLDRARRAEPVPDAGRGPRGAARPQSA